jgi:hypothetical protein
VVLAPDHDGVDERREEVVGHALRQVRLNVFEVRQLGVLSTRGAALRRGGVISSGVRGRGVLRAAAGARAREGMQGCGRTHGRRMCAVT